MNSYQKTFAALADPTRLSIFEQLRAGPSPAGRLAEGLPVSRPAVSQHLAVLKGAGLVRERRAGTRRIYSVDGTRLTELRNYLDGFWDDALRAFERAADADDG